jgi:hypothetical protein
MLLQNDVSIVLLDATSPDTATCVLHGTPACVASELKLVVMRPENELASADAPNRTTTDAPTMLATATGLQTTEDWEFGG